MELKGRLKLIASKVPNCNIMCDVGTDHAYIPTYLVSNNICKNAIASDVRPGPLKAAQRNIDYYKLGDKIKTRIGNGLENIEINELEAVVVAGMGGELIANILEQEKPKAQRAGTLVLQPMNSIEILREYLFENGYMILDEELAKEDNKYYHVFSVRWTGETQKYEEIYYHIGKKLIENKDPLLKEYVSKKLKKIEEILKEMQKNKIEDKEVLEHYRYLKDEFKRILS